MPKARSLTSDLHLITTKINNPLFKDLTSIGVNPSAKSYLIHLLSQDVDSSVDWDPKTSKIY
jgi:hypothetical protein